MGLFEGNALTALIDRLRAVFVGRNEILTTSGAISQLQNLVNYYESSRIALTAAYQDVPGVTTGSFTPTVNEYAYVCINPHWDLAAGTAPCNAADQLNANLDLFYSAADHNNATTHLMYAPGAAGTIGGSMWHVLTLTAGTAYTIKLRAQNVTGNRGASGYSMNMMVMRVAR